MCVCLTTLISTGLSCLGQQEELTVIVFAFDCNGRCLHVA